VIECGDLGRKAVAIARAEFDMHVHETAGPKATARISEYHAGARRGGSHVAGMPGHEHEGDPTLGEHASDEIPWCASAASFCAYQAALAVIS
jgi:putative hemolysin